MRITHIFIKKNISMKKIQKKNYQQYEQKIFSYTEVDRPFYKLINIIIVFKAILITLTWLFKFLHCSTVSAIPFDPGYLIIKLKIL